MVNRADEAPLAARPALEPAVAAAATAAEMMAVTFALRDGVRKQVDAGRRGRSVVIADKLDIRGTISFRVARIGHGKGISRATRMGDDLH